MPTSLLRGTATASVALSLALGTGQPARSSPPPNPRAVDLAALGTTEIQRTNGSIGTGTSGVPVAGGFDVDGDGHRDVAFASMRASPLSRSNAGAVFLVFGDGTAQGAVDTAVVQERVLRIAGAQSGEYTGSEIWMDDLDGDGDGDLIVCRQGYSLGRGAMTILFGDPAVRTFSQSAAAEPLEADQWLDLASPPPGLQVTTIVGKAGERLCIWARTGDIDGNAAADVLVGADQRDLGGTHNGAAYVILGGSHLTSASLFELEDFGDEMAAFGLEGYVAEILAPASSNDYHFGATVQLADLDGGGDEVLIAATINRAGAALGGGHANAGAPFGRLYIGWDDLFPTPPWSTGFSFVIDAEPTKRTMISGANLSGATSNKFGEELHGGLDFDGDGHAELFVGDITGTAPGRSASGLGHVFWEARLLKGASFDLGSLPTGVEKTTLYGPTAGAILADTALQGDFDGDKIADLAVCSPCDDPFARDGAGTVHVLYGRSGSRWPALIDLAPGSLPTNDLVEIAELYGANGASGDFGDTLCYSAAAGDVDRDARIDLIVNEMRGNTPSGNDIGNLLVVPGILFDRPVFTDDFEDDSTDAWTLVRGLEAGGDQAGGGDTASARVKGGTSKRGADGRPDPTGERPVRPPPG